MPKVLFLDDEPALLMAIARVLRNEPYEVVTTTSWEDAMRAINKGDIDVVVSDERMPSMSGGEFLMRVRKAMPKVIRIMLTGESSLAVAAHIIEKGALYQFLSKPTDNAELRRIIAQGLRLRDSERLRIGQPAVP
ncbi:MAG: response regulator [Polyangiaceae bacterium]